ncbi:MAG: rod shape-determining protein MreD [Microthrixaceae bacterium]
MTERLAMIARTALVLFVALALQLGLFDQLRVFSVHAELMLAVGVATAVAWGAERGAIVGFVAGLLTDLILPGRFGVTALAYGLTGYGIGALSDGVARRSRLIDAGLMLLGGAVGVAAYALIAALFGEQTLGDDRLWSIVGIVAVWNAVLSPVLVPVARWAGIEPELRPVR